MAADTLNGLITQCVLKVGELPDRTSPDDWPEAMLVTTDELTGILRDIFGSALLAAEQERDGLREYVQHKEDCASWEVIQFDVSASPATCKEKPCTCGLSGLLQGPACKDEALT